MATVPVRSQPLHNFSLPFLKWGKNQMNNNNNCCRKSVDSSSSSLQHQQQQQEGGEDEDSPPCVEESEVVEFESRRNSIGVRSFKNRFSPSPSRSPPLMMMRRNPILSESETEVKLMKSESGAVGGGRKRSVGSKDEVMEKKDGGEGEGVEVGESAAKPWNLRPRRVAFKAPVEIVGGGASKNGEVQEKPENLPKSLRLRGLVDGQNVDKPVEKQKFWISLSREEIEEDFFILTGSKPSRKPKKRLKTVQRQVDNVCPGMWLAGITADSYSVPDGPAKK